MARDSLVFGYDQDVRGQAYPGTAHHGQAETVPSGYRRAGGARGGPECNASLIPRGQGNRLPFRYMESPVAKATFVKARKVWRVFWHRADMKWHGYPPCPEVRSIEEFLSLVDLDENHCFWG